MTRQVRICGPRYKAPAGAIVVSTVSHAKGWKRGLSPFVLGPCCLYDGFISKNMENAWQYSKVYTAFGDERGPYPSYYDWASQGWRNARAVRYPMGKGKKPLYSWWGPLGKLSYVEARKAIYAPLYSAAVENTDAFKMLRGLYESSKEIWLWDFDGYDHVSLGMGYQDVVDCESKKMGHAFVLGMMLEDCRVWN